MDSTLDAYSTFLELLPRLHMALLSVHNTMKSLVQTGTGMVKQ